MANYIATDTDLTAVADAIRGKTGGTDSLTFPSGFVSAIGGITGVGGSNVVYCIKNKELLDISEYTGNSDNKIFILSEKLSNPTKVVNVSAVCSSNATADVMFFKIISSKFELIRKETVSFYTGLSTVSLNLEFDGGFDVYLGYKCNSVKFSNSNKTSFYDIGNITLETGEQIAIPSAYTANLGINVTYTNSDISYDNADETYY